MADLKPQQTQMDDGEAVVGLAIHTAVSLLPQAQPAAGGRHDKTLTVRKPLVPNRTGLGLRTLKHNRKRGSGWDGDLSLSLTLHIVLTTPQWLLQRTHGRMGASQPRGIRKMLTVGHSYLCALLYVDHKFFGDLCQCHFQGT